MYASVSVRVVDIALLFKREQKERELKSFHLSLSQVQNDESVRGVAMKPAKLRRPAKVAREDLVLVMSDLFPSDLFPSSPCHSSRPFDHTIPT